MTIKETADGWAIVDEAGERVAGTFATNSEAWRALDRLERQPVSSKESWVDFCWHQDVAAKRMV